MNKLFKSIVAILGACHIVFDFATPILLSLLLVNVTVLSPFNKWLVLLVGLLATTFRGFRVWLN